MTAVLGWPQPQCLQDTSLWMPWFKSRQLSHMGSKLLHKELKHQRKLKLPPALSLTYTHIQYTNTSTLYNLHGTKTDQTIIPSGTTFHFASTQPQFTAGGEGGGEALPRCCPVSPGPVLGLRCSLDTHTSQHHGNCYLPRADSLRGSCSSPTPWCKTSPSSSRESRSGLEMAASVWRKRKLAHPGFAFTETGIRDGIK